MIYKPIWRQAFLIILREYQPTFSAKVLLWIMGLKQGILPKIWVTISYSLICIFGFWPPFSLRSDFFHGSEEGVEIQNVPFRFGRIIDTFDLTIHSMRTLFWKTGAKLPKGIGEKRREYWPNSNRPVLVPVSDVYSVCEYVYDGSTCTVGRHATLGWWQEPRKGLVTTYLDHSWL